MALALLMAASAPPARALPPQAEAFCFAVADSGDNLVFINKDGDGFLDMGPTGTAAMEAIAFNPDDRRLYAIDGDTFGYLDYDDAFDGDGNDSEFVQISPDVGTCTLPDTMVVTIDDVDGLQFDFTRTDASTGTFVLWASVRDGDGTAPDDVLVQIDPATGLVDTTPTPGFTGGATCVRVSGSGILNDIDDIAVDPTSGAIYGVNNISGGTDQLVAIDPITGAGTVVGPFLNVAPPPVTITDMEGMSYGVDGTLFGTTGSSGSSANDFWSIDESTRDTTRIAAFPTLGDYESVACLTDNLMTGTVFFDVEENGLYDPGIADSGFGDARVVVYIDQNDDGAVDGGDTPLCENPAGGFNLVCPVTANDGTWSFPVGQGSFVAEVDTATLPVGYRLTTDNHEEADFAVLDFGVLDPGNDYGFILPPGSGDLDVSKTSDAGGAVVQGQMVSYTIVVTNNTGSTHTQIGLADILPAGVTYVAQSTTVVGPVAGSYRDEFSSVAYGNSDGSLDWTSSSWAETGDDGTAAAGSIRISGGELLLEGSAGNPERIIERQFDLTGAADALLRYSWRCVGDMESTEDFVHVEASADGGGSWSPIESKEGEIDMCLEPSDSDAGSESFSLASLIDADPTDSRVRLRYTISAVDETFFVDNVDILVIPAAASTRDNVPAGAHPDLADGVPPRLLEPADGFALAAGQSLTATLQVTVDNPLAPFHAALLNLAVADSFESSLPEVGRHLDPVASGAIGDLVWLDADGDGLQDVGEPGLVNVELTLYDAGGDGMPGGGDDTALGTRSTGIDGGYLFDHLAPGVYFVDVTDATVPSGLVLAPGSTDPSATFTVTSGEILLSADFGYRNSDPGNAVIGDFVWNDIDRDGFQDPGEVGIGGVTVELVDLGTGMAVGAPATTGADGRYLFTGVAPGEYEVRVTDTGSVLTGSSPTTGPQSEGGFVSAPVTVTAGQLVDDVDFGFAPDACLPRIDFERDAAGNSIASGQILDNEWSAWGVTLSFSVNAPSTGPLMAFDSAVPSGGDVDLGTPNETCTAPGAGVGVAGELGQPGENCVVQDHLLIISEDGSQFDPDDAGDGGTITFDFASDVEVEAVEFVDAENTLDSVELFDQLATSIFFSTLTAPGDNAYEKLTVDTAGARQMVITFPGSGAVAAVDFCLGSIRDRVWLDADGDGLFDILGPDGLPGTGDEERGIAGVTVDLLDASGNVIATAFTDADGEFGFDGLADGVYTISISDTAALLNPFAATTAAAVAGSLGATVTGGVDVVRISFGYNSPGVIGDTVFSDADSDGVQDPGEVGIAGVTVVLWQDIDGDGAFDDLIDSMVGSTITGADGSYLFAGLAPGTYFASVDGTQPALSGYFATTLDEETGPNAAGLQVEAVLVGLGDSFLEADFGFQNGSLAELSGTVFEDLDVDGVNDVGETGFSGVTVELLDASGNSIATTTMDASGDYTFFNLAAGDYTVRVTDLSGVLTGYMLTSGLDAIDVTVTGVGIGGIDFGYARDPLAGSIGDALWLDADADGIQGPAESGIGGVTVELWPDLDGDGVFEPGGDDGSTPLATAVTDAGGNYIFAGLGAGLFFVNVDETTLPESTPGDLVETSYPVGVDPSAVIYLSDKEVYRVADFGYVPAAGTAVLGDRVWYDADADGLQDAGEVGIAGVDLVISGPSCMPSCTVTTGADGTWLATGLAPGSYVVQVQVATLPAGYNPTPTNTGGDDTYNVTVVAGDIFTQLDFGFDGGTTGSIGDRVYLDSNGDGAEDPGEAGIEGVTIDLIDSGSGAILATTTTDSSGGYYFLGLPAGSYDVVVTDIHRVLDTLNATETPWLPIVITAVGEDVDSVDFGYAASEGIGVIGSSVWHDLDDDGIEDPGEPGIEGVTIELWLDDGDDVFEPFGGQDNLLRSVATDVNGEYEFVGLLPATYFVTVSDDNSVLAGFVKTPPAPFACPGADGTSKVDPCRIAIAAGSPGDPGVDFGYRANGPPLSIAGTVFEDQDNDGLFDDPAEPVAQGAVVSLYRLVGGSRFLVGTTTSDINGDYTFTDLPPGDYEIEVDTTGTAVDDYLQTTQSGTGGVQPVTLSVAGGNVTDQDFGFWSGGFLTTPVTLAGFEATGGGTVEFRWTTSTEVGNVGFHVWSVEGDGMVRLTDELIPTVSGDSLEPQAYTFEAHGVAGDTFVLEDRDIYGASRYHGPFRLGERRGRTVLERRAIDWQSIRRGHTERAEKRRAERVLAAGATERIDLGGAADVDVFRAQKGVRGGGLGGGRGQGRSRKPALRIFVDQDSIYRVTYEDLLAAGADWAGVRLDDIHLENRGSLVPVRAVGAGGGDTFGPGAYFEFVGEGLDTLYTKTNVYRLEAKPGGARVVEDGSSAFGASAPSYYLETVETERQVKYHFASPSDDPWFEQRLLALSGPVEGSFALDLEGWVAGAAPVTLRVEMWGVTDFSSAPDHHVSVRVNEVELADEWFDGLVDHPVEVEVPDSVLDPWTNSLTLHLPHDTGADYDLVHYDGLAVTYPRHFRARAGRLSFSGAGEREYRVDGLPSSDVVVYRVTEGGQVVYAAGGSVSGVPGDYAVTFAAEPEPAEIHVAAVESLPVAAFELAVPKKEIGRRRADLVIVAHPDFVEGVEPLARERRREGLKVEVVDVTDVYEQFGHGIVDPEAIKRYLSQAYHESGAEFALLVGGDTYDYFDYLGTGSMSFIPTPYARTDEIVHFAPVDSLYVDFDSDGLVEMALGRLPVRTVEELERVIDKTLRYDRAGYEATAVLAADGADLTTGYSFAEASEEMRAGLPQDWQAELAYMDVLGVDGARQVLVDAIDRGVALTSYFGHSGPTVWSFDDLFNTEDAAALENQGRPTVVAQWGCWNTYHVAPGFDTLSHVLMLADERGAAAVLGAATLTQAASEKKLGTELYGRIGLAGMPLGRAIVDAKRALGSREPDRLDVLWGWTLLGDPTLVVQP